MTTTQDTWPAGATAILNVTLQQANAAGGAIVVDLPAGAANEYILIDLRAVNSGTNGLAFEHQTTGAVVIGPLASIASGAGTDGRIPSIGSAASASGNLIDSRALLVSGTDRITARQTAAGAVNDTLQVIARFRVKNSTPPDADFSRSTNAVNVTATAGSVVWTVL